MIDEKPPKAVKHAHQSTKRIVNSSKFQIQGNQRHVNAGRSKCIIENQEWLRKKFAETPKLEIREWQAPRPLPILLN